MRYRNFGALLLAVPLSAAGILASGKSETASASPAPMPAYFEGADGMGALLAGGQGSVEVEAHLSFSLSEFPLSPMEGTAEAFREYGGKFTAEYTFHNPADAPQELNLVLPLGTLPDYFPCEELDRTTLGYSVKQDGRDAEVRLRHSMALRQAGGRRFDAEEGLRRLYGRSQDFYTDDLPVTAYTYRVEATPSDAESDDFEYVNFSLSFGASAKRTRVLSCDRCGYGVKDGRAKLTYGFDCREESVKYFTVYVLGEDIEEPETHVFRYENNAAVALISSSVTAEPRETASFADFALSFRGEQSAVSDEDWKNAFIDGVEDMKYSGSCYSDFSPSDLEIPGALMQWYEYSVTVPANGSTVNTVTAPIYPTVDGTHSQDLYLYRFLLSPAQVWDKFGRLTVDIDTPFYISDSSLNFSPREGGGYTLTRESLPLGELTFTLTEQERLSSDKNLTNYDNGGNSALVTAIVIMCIVVAGAASVAVVIAVQSRKRKKRREEEEMRLLQTRPQEGKIDLPDDKDQ